MNLDRSIHRKTYLTAGYQIVVAAAPIPCQCQKIRPFSRKNDRLYTAADPHRLASIDFVSCQSSPGK